MIVQSPESQSAAEMLATDAWGDSVVKVISAIDKADSRHHISVLLVADPDIPDSFELRQGIGASVAQAFQAVVDSDPMDPLANNGTKE